MIDFSDSSWQDCPEIVRSTVAYIIFYKFVAIDHVKHVLGPVARSSAEIEYTAKFTAGMSLAHFRMLFHKLFIKDPDIVP